MANTISDKDWRNLQDRAAKANSKLANIASREAADNRRADAERRNAAKKGRN